MDDVAKFAFRILSNFIFIDWVSECNFLTIFSRSMNLVQLAIWLQNELFIHVLFLKNSSWQNNICTSVFLSRRLCKNIWIKMSSSGNALKKVCNILSKYSWVISHLWWKMFEQLWVYLLLTQAFSTCSDTIYR